MRDFNMDFILDKVGLNVYKNFPEVYVREDKCVNKSLSFNSWEVLVNLRKILERFYAMDDICLKFNYLNTMSENLKNYRQIGKMLNLKDPDYYKELGESFFENKKDYDLPYAFHESGIGFLISELGEDFIIYFFENFIQENLCNTENFLDTNVMFYSHKEDIYKDIVINDNLYCLISIHNGGDLRGNYFNYLMFRPDIFDGGIVDLITLSTRFSVEVKLNKKLINEDINSKIIPLDKENKFLSEKLGKDYIRSANKYNSKIKKEIKFKYEINCGVFSNDEIGEDIFEDEHYIKILK